jgi:flagellin-like protein
MKIGELFTDEEAVSPVIGVILMVAITVILAAVIGAFVLNIGGSQDTAPSASFDFEETDTAGQVEVTLQSASGTIENWRLEGGSVLDNPSDIADAGDSLSAGTSFIVELDTDKNEINIVWDSPKNDQSSIIGSYEAETTGTP